MRAHAVKHAVASPMPRGYAGKALILLSFCNSRNILARQIPGGEGKICRAGNAFSLFLAGGGMNP